MAFPTIPTGGRVLSNVQANTTATRTFPSLTGLTKNSGDLLLALCFVYQSSVSPLFTGWTGSFTEFFDPNFTGVCGIGAAYKFSDGTETGTIAVTQTATVTGHANMILLSIPDAHLTTPPEASGFATGASSGANPGLLTPSWGAGDTLWIACAAVGETATTGSFTDITASPTNYGSNVLTGLSSDVVGGMFAGVGFRQNNAASEDPGQFANDTSNTRWAGLTIGVQEYLEPPSSILEKLGLLKGMAHPEPHMRNVIR